MKMQPIRVGVASLIAATVIGAGVTAPTVGAAPAVNTNSTVQTYFLNQDSIKEIANKYGIDLGNINFGGGSFNCPFLPGNGTVTQPTQPTQPTAPSTDAGTVTKPTTPSTDAGTVTKPTTPSTGTGSTTKPTTPSTGTGTGNTDSGTANMSAFQSQVVDLVNQERSKAGLSGLTVDTLLTKVATEKARDMDVNNYFSHTSPTYGSPFDMMRQFGVTYSYAGENIASGQRTPQEVMNAWMNSPGHRANILNGSFKEIGVGYVNGEWVQMFIG